MAGLGAARVPITSDTPPFREGGKVMRARQRRLIAVLSAVVAAAIAFGPASPARADDHNCPQGTSWDNRVQRCV